MKPEEIEHHFAAGERIVEPQSQGQRAYVVRSGTVRIEGRASGEDECLGPGDLFGAVATILGEPYGFLAVAESDVEILLVEIDVLNSLCAESPEFAMRLIRHLAGRVVSASSPVTAPRVAPRAGASGSFRRVCEVLLSRAEDGDGPRAVPGDLASLAEGSDLSMAETYLQIQQLLDDRVLRLSEDLLTIEEPGRLSELMENPRS